MKDTTEIVVVTMYKFLFLPDCAELRRTLLGICQQADLKGTLLLAEEGVNGTVAGTRQGVKSLLDFFAQDQRFADLEYKLSVTTAMPFYRMKIKLKKEIVTMGVPATDPAELSGKKVDYRQWNALLSDPEVLVIDTRNDYEHKIGTFRHAIPAQTNTFREFPEFVRAKLDPQQHKKIALFCTGGIRCEKATNYLLKQNFSEVYHLDGGILKYLEDLHNAGQEEENLWQGDCFVFDGRVAVDKDLQAGNYAQCFACRRPLSEEEQRSDAYVRGVSCPHCIGTMTDEKYQRVSERQRQVTLAEGREQQHIGTPQPSNKLSGTRQ